MGEIADIPPSAVPAVESLESRIKTQTRTIGFDLVGITSLGPAETAPHFDAWVEAGFAGTMGYLETGGAKRQDTRLPFEGGSSAIVVALNYGGTQPAGPVARYARGDDYHDAMLDMLNALHRWLPEAVGHPVRGKAYVDTGPILERDLARRAGLGWFGKNTNLINPGLGSFFFIGSLLVDLALQSDAPFDSDRCGTCTRCLDACPTDAFVDAHRLDATRCISYLTIELRGAIPESLRAGIGEHVYGCDVCQDVCPWNVKFARDVAHSALQPRPDRIDPSLLDLMRMSRDEWQTFARKSPIKRTKRRGLLRNVAVALGNRRATDAVPALVAALADEEPLVRSHAAWALARIDTADAWAALEGRVAVEEDADVGEALRVALQTRAAAG